METTVIIPSRAERWLDKTINEVKTKFMLEHEIVVVLEGKPITKMPTGVTYIYNKEPLGMRSAINQAVVVSQGKYIMKLDAHCMLDKDIDIKLIRAHQPNWVQIPTRKRLDAHNWCLFNGQKPVNYMKMNSDYMGRPVYRKGKFPIDDTEVFQGSCYFMEKEYFNKLELLDNENFGEMGFEAQEIAFKVRHDGGRVVRNKNTWYAHARASRKYVADRSKSRDYIDEFVKKYA